MGVVNHHNNVWVCIGVCTGCVCWVCMVYWHMTVCIGIRMDKYLYHDGTCKRTCICMIMRVAPGTTAYELHNEMSA